MLLLGIETSCDETAASVVRDGVCVLSSVIASQHEIHEQYAGVVPELASRAHMERLEPVIAGALEQAGVTLAEIDAFAVGSRPGLVGSLLIGVNGAKALAWATRRPLVAVDHVHAHLYAGILHEPHHRHHPHDPAPTDEILFPALGLVVSGGHTSLYLLRDWLRLERLGATIDDALGEAYDKVATILGLPYPGGPNLDRLAQSPGASDRIADLPLSRLSPTSLDFSFSGLKTAVLYEVRGAPAHPAHKRPDSRYIPPPPMDDERRRDLAATFQRAACRAITLKLERALEQTAARGITVRSLLAGGGVTANSRLRAELQRLASDRSLRLALPPLRWCVDNAAMIGGLGHRFAAAGQFADLSLQPTPTTLC